MGLIQANFSADTSHVLAALMSVSSEMQAQLAGIGLTGTYTVAGGSGAKALGELLSADGDPDHDGLTNLQEYNNVIASGGTPEDYTAAALNPLACV